MKWVAATAFLLLSCSSDRTSLLVEVTSPLAVPTEVDALQIAVVGDVEGRMTGDRFYELSTAFPHSVSIRPGAIENQGVTITVTALLGGGFVARRVVRSAFVPGEQVVVRIDIPRSCVSVVCADGEDCVDGSCVTAADGGVPDSGPEDGGLDGGPVDAGCETPTDCDDGVACTVDTCQSGACQNEPDDARCADGNMCDPVAGCPPRTCQDDGECTDSVACNGMETCLDMTCASGTVIDCNDMDACTSDRCDETMRGDCVYTTADVDADGFGSTACPELGGVPATDCNDGNPEVFPGAPEVCNGLDDDCLAGCDDGFTCCRGETSDCTTSCGSMGSRTCMNDCTWSACTAPAETCNARDDDCDTRVDETFTCAQGATSDCTTTCASTGSRACGASCTYGACTPPAEGCNGRDDDCDTRIDETVECTAGMMGSCTTPCGSTGSRTCGTGCTWGTCAPPAETCNRNDDDCDGRVDETFTCVPMSTGSCTTGCGTGGTRTCSASCTWGTCNPPVEACNGSDDDCDMMCDEVFTCCAGSGGSCMTTCGSTGTRTCSPSCGWSACSPPAETCNGLDDDCNTTCDDGFTCCAGRTGPCTTTCGSTGSRLCSAGCAWGSCTAPTETCNAADDDCDMAIDEAFACVQGSMGSCMTSCGSTGTRTCSGSCAWGSCAPPAESCNGEDDDCDSNVDEGCGACGGCAGAVGVGAPGGRSTVALTTSSHMGTCGGPGSEGTLTFTLAATSDVFITTHEAGGLDTLLYVRSCTCTGMQVGCNDDADGRTTSMLRLTGLAAGTYNVFVDTKSVMSGTVPVDIYITPPGPASDRCGNPTFITPGTGSISGETCSFANDAIAAIDLACDYAFIGGAEDRVYYFYLPTSRTVTFDACNMTDYDTSVYVRQVCTDASAPNQVACNDDGCGPGGMACDGFYRSNVTATLGPGLFYVWADGYDDPVCGCGNFRYDLTGI